MRKKIRICLWRACFYGEANGGEREENGKNRANSWLGACLGMAQMMKRKIYNHVHTNTDGAEGDWPIPMYTSAELEVSFAINWINYREQMEPKRFWMHSMFQVKWSDNGRRRARANIAKCFCLWLLFVLSILVSGTFRAYFATRRCSHQNIYVANRRKKKDVNMLCTNTCDRDFHFSAWGETKVQLAQVIAMGDRFMMWRKVLDRD